MGFPINCFFANGQAPIRIKKTNSLIFKDRKLVSTYLVNYDHYF